MKKSVQNGPVPLRPWTVRLAWGAGVLPFFAVSLLAFRQQDVPCPLQPAAVLELHAPLMDSSMATDRIGDHFVAADAEGRLHTLRMENGRVVDDVIKSEYLQSPNLSAIWITWLDANQDELLDVQISATEIDCADLDDCLGMEPADQQTELFRQVDGRFVHQPNAPRQSGTPQQLPESVYSAKGAYGLSPSRVGRSVTRLVDEHGTQDVLNGEVVRAGDLNDDGSQEILTLEPIKDEPTCRLRIYTWQNGSYREIWTRTVPEMYLTYLPMGEPYPVGNFADLDGDGRSEFLLVESDTGRISVYTWDDSVLPPVE